MPLNQNTYIRLDGQLGNQLFQLALAIKISQEYKINILLDDYLPERKKFKAFLFQELAVFDYFSYCNKFNVWINRIQHNFTLRKFYKSDDLFIESEHKDFSLLFSKVYSSYTGFFQSPSLFPDKKTLVKAFALKSDLIDPTLNKLLLLAQESQSLAVSIRRGDFLQCSHLGVCSEEYYLNSIEHIRLKKDINCIFVFSDDINYCRGLLSELKGQVVFVEGLPPAKSLYLMSQCKHFVIANSTFSWWGAWLSESEDKLVICPSPWNDDQPIASDFIPSDWEILPKHSQLTN